jgi:RNA-directed DNA polymerase
MRQKNQIELNLGTGATGEARSAAAEETEARAARPDIESRAAVGPSMEAIVERNNLRKALGCRLGFRRCSTASSSRR